MEFLEGLELPGIAPFPTNNFMLRRAPGKPAHDNKGETSMRKPIIAGNWKMNMTPSEAGR